MQTINKNTKIFGLGLSKTGTSSLCEALNILGISSIHYPFDEKTFQELRSGNYHLSILENYQSIVDIPVAPYYAQLDKAFPGSKFILTIRDMPSWLRSIDKHWELMMKWWDNYPDFKKFHEFIGAVVYGAIDFNKERFQFVYEMHVRNVLDYFKDRPDDLLVLNIIDGEGWNELGAFLNIPVTDIPFPHANEWMHKLMEATQEMKTLIAAGEAFVLVDQEGFGEEFSAGRNKIPFLEKGGQFDGMPTGDQQAIDEFERLKLKNPRYVVFGWPCFWWLDYYKIFHQYLINQSTCILENERLIIYQLI